MEDLKSIVVLIDADNAQLSKLSSIFEAVSMQGKIHINRAYGNWTKDNLIDWGPVVNRFGIKTIQQFDLTRGTDEIPAKNATDISIVVDAMELLQRDLYDTFVIVAGDSDYTPLVHKLKEYCKDVIIVGKKNTVMALRRACTEFISFENLKDDETLLEAVRQEKARKAELKRANTAKAEEEGAEKEAERETAHDPVKKTKKKTGKAPEEPASAKKEAPVPSEEPAKQKEETAAKAPAPQLDEMPTEEEDELSVVHHLFRVAADTWSEDGYTNISAAANYVKRMRPDFEPITYGAKNFPAFLEKYPTLYEVKRYKGKGTVTIVAYRCIGKEEKNG